MSFSRRAGSVEDEEMRQRNFKPERRSHSDDANTRVLTDVLPHFPELDYKNL